MQPLRLVDQGAAERILKRHDVRAAAGHDRAERLAELRVADAAGRRRRRRRAVSSSSSMRVQRRTSRRSRSAAVSSGDGHAGAVGLPRAGRASARARPRARARGRAASRPATRRSRRAAAPPRTPRRSAPLAREQVPQQRRRRSASAIRAPPSRTGPAAAGSPWSTRTVPRWFGLVRADAGGLEPQLERRELGERLEVGAHLALLEVLGEAKGVLGAVRSRGKRARVLRGALGRGGGVPPRSSIARSRLAACARSCALIACTSARASPRQHLEARPVRRERRALEREQRAQQRHPRARPRAGRGRRIAAAARGEHERRRGAAERLAPGHVWRHAAAD